jgi:hypothetical protein
MIINNYSVDHWRLRSLSSGIGYKYRYDECPKLLVYFLFILDKWDLNLIEAQPVLEDLPTGSLVPVPWPRPTDTDCDMSECQNSGSFLILTSSRFISGTPKGTEARAVLIVP